MKKSLLVALFAAMPLLAQECPKMPECGKARPCCAKKMNRPQLSEEQKAEMKAKFEARKAEMLAKFDADKDGKLSADERKAAHEAHKAEMKAKFMEKFDADKDDQLSDAEKEAVKADFEKNAPKFRKGPRRGGKCCGKKGPRRPHSPRPQLSEEQKAEMKAKFMEKFDADKDGKLSDAEKEAVKAEMKAKFEARRAEMKAKFMEKFDADKDGQLSDAEKEAAKAEFKKNAPKFRKGPRRGCKCCGKKGPRRPHGPRPELSEEQKAEMKAKFMEKFDADKDGQLSDAEKEAAKAEFKKNAPKFRKGPRRGCKCCK
ncbi:MAG: hypothetical protein IIV41_05990 [Akkermansia sp.]|nr:hypothetical protein [Akkermansia sp.]